MSASTATTPARPVHDGNGSFESRRAWVNEDGSPNRRVLADVVQRIVRAVDPDRILLFGSGARGTMKSGSPAGAGKLPSRTFGTFGRSMKLSFTEVLGVSIRSA